MTEGVWVSHFFVLPALFVLPGKPGICGGVGGTGFPRHDGRYRVSPVRRKRGWYDGGGWPTLGTGCPRHDGRYRVSPVRRKVPGVPGTTEGGGMTEGVWVRSFFVLPLFFVLPALFVLPGKPGICGGVGGYRVSPVRRKVPGVPGTTKEGGMTEGTGCPRYDGSRCAHKAAGAAVWPPLLGWLRYVRLVARAPPVVSWRSRTGLPPSRQLG